MSNYLQPHGLYSLWNSPGQNTGVGSISLLQGIFPAQELNPPTLQVDSLPAEPQGKSSLNLKGYYYHHPILILFNCYSLVPNKNSALQKMVNIRIHPVMTELTLSSFPSIDSFCSTL